MSLQELFSAQLKLKEKIREGGKIRRKYEKPRTPYERVMESAQIPERSKKRLNRQYESMKVAELHRQIEGLRNRLFDLIEGKRQQEPSTPKLRGPSINLKSRSTAFGMEKTMDQTK